MKPEEIDVLRRMSDEDLEKDIPNWKWFKSLKPGDKAVVFVDSYGLLERDHKDNKEVTVKQVNNNGSVEVEFDCDGKLLKFFYCRYPNEMDVIIGLIPPENKV